jgi:CDP-4-dehydro-6-deoxyglucose reductase
VGARRDLYHIEKLARWQAQHDRFSLTPVHSELLAEDDGPGRRGVVHQARLADNPDLSRVGVYMAGPPPMIEAAQRGFADSGLSSGHLHFDSFGFAVDWRVPVFDIRLFRGLVSHPARS